MDEDDEDEDMQDFQKALLPSARSPKVGRFLLQSSHILFFMAAAASPDRMVVGCDVPSWPPTTGLTLR